MTDLIFSKLVQLVAENSNESNVILRRSMVDFIQSELLLDLIRASQLTDLIVYAVKNENGLDVINDKWHFALMQGQDDNNPQHPAFYYKRAAKAICSIN